MALKIVTGGSTGAADGTLVSSGNPLIIVALNTAVDAHIRCDDGYWSNDQDFDVPAELEVSFDAGSTWYDNADEPITAPEIYAVNVPIKIRQTTAAASTSGSFVTDGTYTAIAALSTPTLTVTPGDTQNSLSWTNVSNEDASPGYTVESSADGSSWSAETTTAANSTTYTDTGLTNGVIRYYRVKAEGSGRYSDSGWGTGNGTPAVAPFVSDTFTDSDDVLVTSHTGETGATWAGHPNYYATGAKILSNRVRNVPASDGTRDQVLYASGSPPDADYAVSAVFRRVAASSGSNRVLGILGRMSTSATTWYGVDYNDTATPYLRLFKFVAGSFTSLGTYTVTFAQDTDYTVKLEMNGTAIKAYLDGVERISATDSAVTAAGKAGFWNFPPSGGAAESASVGIHLDTFTATQI